MSSLAARGRRGHDLRRDHASARRQRRRRLRRRPRPTDAFRSVPDLDPAGAPAGADRMAGHARSGDALATVERDVLDRETFARRVASRESPRASPNAGVFVHGFNCSFQESLYLLAEVAADADLDIVADSLRLAVGGGAHRLRRRQGRRHDLPRRPGRPADDARRQARGRPDHGRRPQHGRVADDGGGASAPSFRQEFHARPAERHPGGARHRRRRVPLADGGGRSAHAAGDGAGFARRRRPVDLQPSRQGEVARGRARRRRSEGAGHGERAGRADRRYLDFEGVGRLQARSLRQSWPSSTRN